MPHSPILGLPRDIRRERLGEGTFYILDAGRLREGALTGIKPRDPKRYLALERYKPWWVRPTFGTDSFALEFETQFVLWETEDGRYGVALPLVSGDLRAFFKGDGPDLRLEWNGVLEDAYPAAAGLLYAVLADDPYVACETAALELAMVSKRFRLRAAKPVPDFVDQLGWCTWDAFYREVSADKVLEGLQTFADRDVPIRWTILDDGWQTVDEKSKLLSFDPVSEKFPEGLEGLTTRARSLYGIEHFGVWHTLQGYWKGVAPDGPLAERYRIASSPDNDRSMVHPDDVARFFQEYHDHLRRAGVDFVKVDNQSSLEQFSEGLFGRGSTMRTYQHALQGSAFTHFKGGLIHCMSNTSDVAYNMLASTIWRNSDDFFPKQPESHQFHVHTNAMNNLWSSQFSVPDWDMFQSHHEHGAFHAASRAISGGPIYTSDRPGEQNGDTLRRLCDDDGRLYRCPAPAMPTRDCLFTNCLTEPRLLKIANTCTESGNHAVLGLFHCQQGEDPITDLWGVTDNPFVDQDDVVVYRFREGTLARLCGEETSIRHALTLAPLEFEVIAIANVLAGRVACVGLLEKYNAGGAIDREEFTVLPSRYEVSIRGSGTAGFYCDSEPDEVLVDGDQSEYRYDPETSFLQVDLRPNSWGGSLVTLVL
jgi:raffinose synthase